MFFAEMSPIELFAAQFGVLGIALFVAGLVLNNCFNRWLSASEREHARKLASLEAEHIKRLELLNKQEEIKFYKLHEIRAQHIAELHKKITHFYNAGASFLPGRKADKQMQEDFFKSLTSVSDYAESVKIYFSKSHWNNISGFVTKLRELCYDKIIFIEEPPNTPAQFEEDRQKYKERNETLRNDIPNALAVIEEQFRQLLGVEEK